MAQTGANSIAVLDLGSAKICCLIAKIDAEGDARITGVGHLGSSGFESGAVKDLSRASELVRRVVQQAETMAGHVVDQIVLITSGGHLPNDILRVEVAASGHAIETHDITKAVRLAEREVHRPEAVTLHAVPACFTVDGHSGIRNPQGLLGENLTLDVNVVSIEPNHFGTLEALANTAMLDVPAVISSGYAAAQACLHDEEKELGVACVDLGGGISSSVIFCGGKMVFSAADAIGSDMISRTLAKQLGLPLSEADRLKKTHGRVWQRDADFKEVIAIDQRAQSGRIEHVEVRKAHLISLIRPDVEEILNAVAKQLKRAGFVGRDAGPVVLTGGGAQLQGIHQLAEQILGCPVRFGFPPRLAGLPAALRGPSFASAVGGLVHVMSGERSELSVLSRQLRAGGTLSSAAPMWPKRMLRWLRSAW
ncbi:MAG: cell division protein FtsA [Pseudomonadota bacterium]